MYAKSSCAYLRYWLLEVKRSALGRALPRILHAEFPSHLQKDLDVCKGQLIARLHIRWSPL